MKKILLLTTSILLLSARVYSACNPNLPTCQCGYPEMKNGIIGCSADYCAADGKKCMPDGSCCSNYCEATEECCSDNQTCDRTKGCVEAEQTCTSNSACPSNLCNTSTGFCCPPITVSSMSYRVDQYGYCTARIDCLTLSSQSACGIDCSEYTGTGAWVNNPDMEAAYWECIAAGENELCFQWGGKVHPVYKTSSVGEVVLHCIFE